jgi:hypothetical protein
MTLKYNIIIDNAFNFTSALKVETLCSSEMLVPTYRTTRYHKRNVTVLKSILEWWTGIRVRENVHNLKISVNKTKFVVVKGRANVKTEIVLII